MDAIKEWRTILGAIVASIFWLARLGAKVGANSRELIRIEGQMERDRPLRPRASALASFAGHRLTATALAAHIRLFSVIKRPRSYRRAGNAGLTSTKVASTASSAAAICVR